jgi:hypothetical protein
MRLPPRLHHVCLLSAAWLTVIAWRAPTGTAVRAADPPTEAVRLASQILDDKLPKKDREKIIRDHPDLALPLLKALVADMPPDNPKEEYRRIPWIWRVALAAGKRNQLEEIKSIVEFALPDVIDPLRDWQAVVLGGGIINGIGLSGGWADEQLNKIFAFDPPLNTRWQQTLKLASVMADNEKVHKDTRCDALRIVGMDIWNKRGGQLFRYLIKGVGPDLQQAAIGGVGDMRVPCVPQALLSGYWHYNSKNRGFVLNELMREDARVVALLDAIEAGTVKPGELGPARIAKLTKYHDAAIRSRAGKLLASNVK